MRLLRRAGRIFWVMLATFGCGLQNTTAIPPHPCVGVADGGFGYQVTGKLIDARSGAPVCCVSINLEARLDVDPPDLIAKGQAKSDNSGVLEGALGTGKAWGTCVGEDGTMIPPPEAPELNQISVIIEGEAQAVDLAQAQIGQDRAEPGKRLVDLGTLRVVAHPNRPCEPTRGNYCPLPPGQLRSGAASQEMP
jgi:hypothetical protein